jgi:predicted transcriptional regulator
MASINAAMDSSKKRALEAENPTGISSCFPVNYRVKHSCGYSMPRDHTSWYAEVNAFPMGENMAEATITIRVDTELKTAFARAAEARNRTDEELLREFIQDYIETQRTDSEYEQWFRRQVQIGIDAADAGELIPADEVEAEFAALRAASPRNLLRSA